MIKQCIERYPVLASCQEDMQKAVDVLVSCYERGGKLLICGNGGSSADAEHIVGELMKGFMKKRPLCEGKRREMCERIPEASVLLDDLQNGLPAIALPSLVGLNSAFCNDVEPSMIYAQSVFALAKPGDVVLGISTSGNSENVLNAMIIAKAMGITVLTMTGETGGALKNFSDVCIRVPATETYRVQELHLPVYHALCAELESAFFSE